LGFAPDSTTLYSWSGDKKVRFWDVATGKTLREFATDPEVYIGCFSPNGKWLVCGSRKEPLLLYDMATGTAVHRLEIPAMGYGDRHFAISRDSRTLAAGDEEGNIHLVELASGKFRRHLLGGHQGSISALLFSADSKRLVSGSTDTTAIVWDLMGQRNRRRKPLSTADLQACWTDLAGDDAERAYQAICRLANSPSEMVPYLSKQLPPVETLLQKQGKRSLSSRRLRMLRALEALELAGTPQARQLLQKLADGAPQADLAREAKESLERLAGQPVTAP
jgi:WD40 repeat protein